MFFLIIAARNDDFRNGDFIIYPSEKQLYNGRIIDIVGEKAKIEICVCAKNIEDPIIEVLEVNLTEIRKKML